MRQRMQIRRFIMNSEKELIPSLESFFRKVYGEGRLISHGIEHHQRVWEYAKELLRYMEDNGFIFDQTFIQKLIIACFLHDIGMSVDTGLKHGYHSSILCKRFLKEQNIDESEYQDILLAIENHDDKEYSSYNNQDLLLMILSVADDLDAFGEEGISRYPEIYIARGATPEVLSDLIINNAQKRFEHFEEAFSDYPQLIEKHRERYNSLTSHFKTKNEKLKKFTTGF